MRNLLHALLVLTLLVAPRSGAARDERGAVPGVAAASLHWREDAILVRLSAAATRALPAPAGALRLRTRSLGLPALDAVAAALGGATFEREFPPAPATGSPRLADLAARAADERLAAFHLVHLPPGVTRDAALAAFRGADGVESAEPIALAPVEALPNDSLWAAAWGFWQPSRRDIHAPEAWDVCRGDTAIVVGIVDTGVLLHHPDLREQLWTNAAEAAGAPGVDDDHDGYIDDVHGWDFVSLSFAGEVVAGEDWRDEDNDPNDFIGHGTAVAGLLGARTNNGVGVAGTAWDVRLLPLRAGYSSSVAPSGWVDLSFAARAIVYGARHGAQVLNLSFASTAQVDLSAACDEATRLGVVLVTAAGNGQPQHYLADRDDAIGVTATDAEDRVPTWANRGTFVTLAAPGVELPSTLLARYGADSLGLRTPAYTTHATGTSFATPLVSGAAALLQAQRRAQGLPPLLPLEVRLRLEDTADDIAAQNPGASGWGAGRLDLLRALTDPPGPFAVRVEPPTVGPAVHIATLAPPARVAFALLAGQLALADATQSGAVRTVPLSGAPQGGVAAADMGGGRGTMLFVATRAGRIDGFDADGRPLPGWPVPASGHAVSVLAEPALADLDGDGVREIVWGGGDGTVAAWTVDGAPVPGFPRVVAGGTVSVRIAVGELDARPGAEIAAVTGTEGLWLLRGDGTALPGSPVRSALVSMRPVIARVGSPPRPLTVCAASERVVAYDAGGRLVFERVVHGAPSLPPAAADVDGDGADEIVTTRMAPDSVFVLDARGQVRQRWRLPVSVTPSADGVLLLAPLAPGGEFAVLLRSTVGGMYAFTLRGDSLAGYPRTGIAAPSPSIVDLDGDGSQEVIGHTSSDGMPVVLRTAPGSAGTAGRGWFTARGNEARTGTSWDTLSMSIVDAVPPAAVSDLRATPAGVHAVTLAWTAPFDVGPTGRAARYEMRWSLAPIDAANFAAAHALPEVPPPDAAGAAQTLVVDDLPEAATMYFAMRAIDDGENPSLLSNVATARTYALPPAAVTDLRVEVWTDTSLVLRWTATGGDGRSGRPRRYRLRAALAPLDTATFTGAPYAADVVASVDAGGSEQGALRGLAPDTRYWVAVVAEDSSGVVSPLSNEISVLAGLLAGRPGLALLAHRRPSPAPVDFSWQREPGATEPRVVRVFDVGGRLVRTLPVGEGEAGRLTWDGRDRDGVRVRPGLYFASFAAEARTVTTRIVLVE